MTKIRKNIKLVIDGKKVTIPIKSLIIEDINEDMSRIGSLIAHYGVLLATAIREKKQAESLYRNWRAKAGKSILENEKSPEWKIKLEIESGATFVKLKDAISQAEFNVEVLTNYFEALKTNAFVLPSKGAIKRDELSSMNMTTKKGEN